MHSPAYPIAVRVLLAVLWLAALARPADAIVVLALVVPFGSAALAWLDAAPVRLTEAMVLATLSGACLASLARSFPPRRTTSDEWAGLGFCAVVLGSLVVVLAAREVGARSPWLELRGLWLFLTNDYLVGPAPEFAGVADAALLVEGVALVWTLRRRAAGRERRVVAAVVAASVVAAAIAFWQALGGEPASQGVLARLFHARTSGPVSDVNAAGSLFAMAACTAFGLSLGQGGSRAARAVFAGATATLATAIWLSGSRMALIAAIASGALLAAWMRMPDLHRRRSAIAAAALAAALALTAALVGLDPRPAATRTAAHSMSARADFMITGLRMIASAPLFGVGIGRYYEMSGSFMPASIYWFYFHENAHNNFLQIGGELGVIGLGAFLWLLTAAATRVVAAVHMHRDDALLASSGAGAAAFVLTWMTSHPLLVPEVAYSFWIVAGSALARADRYAGPGEAPRRALPLHRLAAVGIVAIVAASVPLRARASHAAQTLADRTFGFYDWENDNGFPYRWTSRRATFFVPAAARELALPVRSMMILGHTDPVTFSVAVDGRVLDTFPITQGNWETVRLRLPGSSGAGAFTRIDVITDPPWIPATTGASHDVRVLGVQLGKPEAQ